jgi:hypothetical protein
MAAHLQEKRTKPLEYQNRYMKAVHQTLEINGKLLGQCLFLKASELPSVSLDPVEERYPKLFSYLIGSTWVDYGTGNESSLRRLVLEAPDHSVDPVQIFGWSLALNHGAIFESILTIHELLRNEARFYRKWVNYESNHEKMSAFFNKFIDIRGDLEERGDAFHGDHRGSWYRIWGAMLDYLAMVAPGKTISGKAADVCSKTEWNSIADIYGSITAIMAELAKPMIMYGSEGDQRKSEINQKGYDAISSMLKPPVDPNPKLLKQCATRKYLVPKPE